MFLTINTSVYYRETQLGNRNHGDTVYRTIWQHCIKQWQNNVDLKVFHLPYLGLHYAHWCIMRTPLSLENLQKKTSSVYNAHGLLYNWCIDFVLEGR